MATITVENRAQIKLEEGFLDRVIKLADLPSGTILLIFHDGGIRNRYGATITRSLIKYNKHMTVFNLYPEECWDCWVILDKDTCGHKEKNPAYFTYLLGHELGHAHICLTDPELHILICLIDMFIRPASDNYVTISHETPHEKRFDQFGIYIAEHLFSRDQLNNEIAELLKDASRKDHARLQNMLSLEASNDLGSIRPESIDLVRPYKDKFLELCKQHIAKLNGHSIATEIDLEQVL